MKKIFQLLKKYWPLVLLLLVIVVLRIPSLYEPNRYADEDIYLTLGQGVRKGLVLYRDIHDNKPPLLYLVAALAGNIFWFKIILLLAHAVGVVFFWKLTEKVFSNKKWLVFISSLIFGLMSTLPRLEGNIANGENFMIVPAIIGAYLIYQAVTEPIKFGRIFVYPLAGFLFSTAFLFKVPVVFDFAGIIIFWWLFGEDKFSIRKSAERIFSAKMWLMIAGFVIPILLSIVYYAYQGAFEPYVRSALMQNIGYLSSWSGGGEELIENPLVWRGLIIVGFLLTLLIFTKKLSLQTRFILIWSVFSMYGALLSSRPYPHYLLEPLVPLSLLVPWFIYKLIKLRYIEFLFAAGVLLLVYLGYRDIDFWYYDTIPYYKNFYEYATGKKDWDDYLGFWGMNRNYKVAGYISENTQENERIFVWGTEPVIYVISDRLPVGRYTVAYHIVDFDAYEDTLEALGLYSPKYIVVIDNSPPFEKLFNFLNKNYTIETQFDGALIYRRL